MARRKPKTKKKAPPVRRRVSSALPPVTILIPTYNRIALLPDALKSALGQTYPNIHVLIYDDGSKDGTLGWLRREVRRHGEERLSFLVSERNRGIAYARQGLLDATKTEFNAWLDSDDMRNRHSVQLQMTAMMKWHPPFVRTSTDILMEEHQKGWMLIPKVGYSKRHAVASSLFRKSCAPSYRTDMNIFGEDILWETEMTTQHGTGMMLPFECYYIRRGRHGRLTAGIGARKDKRKRIYKPRFEAARAEVYKVLFDRDINCVSRVERVGPGAMKVPFDLPADTEMELPTLFKIANLCSSRRQGIEPGPHKISRCPLCGFHVDSPICSQCGRDWSEHCWCPQTKLTEAMLGHAIDMTRQAAAGKLPSDLELPKNAQ